MSRQIKLTPTFPIDILEHRNKPTKSTQTKKLKKKKSSAVKIRVTSGSFALSDKNGKVKKSYHLHLPTKERHKILDALAKEKKGKGNIVGLFRGLLARRTLCKNKLSVAQKQIYTQDMEYLKKKYQNSEDWPKRKMSASYLDGEDSSSDSEENSETENSEDDTENGKSNISNDSDSD